MSNDILRVSDRISIGTVNPIELNFIGRANLWIKNSYDDGVTNLGRQLIVEAISKTAPGQLSVVGFDSDLTGVFAPFAQLSAGDSRQLELLEDMKALEDYLDYLWQHIQGVQNVIQGRTGSLIDFRAQTGRPVEGYVMVVLSLDMGMIESKLFAKLSMLMRKGPNAGVSFLIISTTIMSIGVEAIAPNIHVLNAEEGGIVSLQSGGQTTYKPRDAQTIIEICDQHIEAAKKASLPVVHFDELHDMDAVWTEKSDAGLTFSVGKYGINNVNITIGDEINQRHNALITGAVGQGKSNLISVIIHSLCQRYSPRELQLYLLDFKEGVTLKPFSNVGQDEYLPHAKTLGLESDVSMGIAVLEYLFLEYKRRLKRFKDANKRSIQEYRQEFPDEEMPRIVAIIDEFQLMFGDDNQTGKKVADLLEKSVRLFRAAGIHFILASQTIGGNMALAEKRDNIFSQVPIRIAHKNSISESMLTLGLNNPAAAFLRAREAIVNLDYGEVSQNRKTVIAWADEQILTPLRRMWWERAKESFPPPYVFESERRITVSKNLIRIAGYRKENANGVALLGERISITGEPVPIPISSETGRNIAIIGAPDEESNGAIGMLQSIAVSLASEHAKGDARFLWCDFQEEEVSLSERYPIFAQMLSALGYDVEDIPRAALKETLTELLASAPSNGIGEKIYIFGVGMDKWEYEKDSYGQNPPLKDFAENGPGKGLHFFGWWIKASNFTAQVSGLGNSDTFNTKVFLRLDERSVQSLTNPFVRWTASTNRALISDEVEFSEELVFLPYAPVTQTDANVFRAAVWE
jgi:hypothetical protein